MTQLFKATQLFQIRKTGHRNDGLTIHIRDKRPWSPPTR